MSTIAENNDYTKFVTRSDEMTSFRSDSSIHVGKGAFKGLKNLEAIVLSEDDEGKDVSNRLEAKSIEPNTKFLFLKNYTNTSQTFDMTYGELPIDISGKISVRYVSYSDSSKTEPDISYETCSVSVTGHKAVQKDFEDYSDDEMVSLRSTSYPEVAKMYVGYEFVDNTCAEANMPCYHNSLQLNICMYGLNTDDPEKLGRMSFKIHSIDGYLVGKPSVTLNGVYSLGKLYGKYNTYVRFEGLTISATEYLSRTVSEKSNLPEADAVQSSDTAVLFKKKKSLKTDVHDGFIGIKPYCTLNKINGYADGKAVEGGGFMQQYCPQTAYLRWHSGTSYAGISSIGMNSPSASAWFFTYICDEDGNEQTDEKTGWFASNGTTDSAFRCFQTVANSAVVSSFRLGSPYVVTGHYNTAMFIPYASSMHFSGNAATARLANLSSLAEVCLPCQSVSMTFPNEAFSYAYGLTSFTFGCESGGSKINGYAFRNCTALDNVNLSGVSLVSSNAFYNCTNLRSLSLTNVTSVCANAFINCSSLKSVSFDRCGAISPSAAFTASVLSGIEDVAFSNMDEVPASAFSFGGYTNDEVSSVSNSVKHIEIHNCKSIGGHAFAWCSSVEHINFLEANAIGDYAFRGAVSLADVMESTASSIGHGAFLGCTNLSSIGLEPVVDIGDSAFFHTSLKTAYLPNCTSIGDCAFYNCTSLVSVNAAKCELIGGNITTKGTFDGCISLKYASLPCVAKIGPHAFDKCSALSDITVSTALSEIGIYAFRNCNSISSIDISNVSDIPQAAFRNCSSLSSINSTIITSVGGQSFDNCYSLSAIPLEHAVEIGSAAFRNCSSLSSIDISNVTSIGSNAFSSCRNLMSVSFGEQLTKIGIGAFFKCSSLTSNILLSEENLNAIGASAFAYCSSVSAIDGCIPVTASIGDAAFSYMRSLREIDMLFTDTSIDSKTISKLYAIPQCAFQGCSKLGIKSDAAESIDNGLHVPNVSSIASSAFASCIGISKLLINCYMESEEDVPKPISLSADAFVGCYNMHDIRFNDFTTTSTCSVKFTCASGAFNDLTFCYSFPDTPTPDEYGGFDELLGCVWLLGFNNVTTAMLTSITAARWWGMSSTYDPDCSIIDPLYVLKKPTFDRATDYWSLTGYRHFTSAPVILKQRAHEWTITTADGAYYFAQVSKGDTELIKSSDTLPALCGWYDAVAYNGTSDNAYVVSASDGSMRVHPKLGL